MDNLFGVDVVSRVVHVTTAIVLLGGSIFALLVLLPSAKILGDEAHQQLKEAVNKRWKMLVHIGILLLLVTGFYNYFQQMPKHKGDGLYHGLLGTKIILAFIIFFIASVLVGRAKAFEGWRAKRESWLRIIVLLGLVIVAASGFLKVRGPVVKEAAPPAAVQ